MKRFALSLIAAVSIAVISPAVSFSEQTSKDEPDTRLDQKLTYRADAKSLPDVLTEISEKTGVPFRVSSESRFWQVRQRKVTLFLKDMPLKEFMNQLEKLTDYHISRSGKSPDYSYMLWQDLNGRRREQSTLDNQKEKAEQNRVYAIDDTLKDVGYALRMSQEDADKIKNTNPWLAYLAGTPRGRAYCELLSSIPREKYDLLLKKNGAVFLRDTDLSPAGQAAFKKIGDMVDYKAMKGLYDGKLDNGGTPTTIWITSTHSNISNTIPTVPFWLHVNVRPTDAASDTGGYSADAFMIARGDANLDELNDRPSTMNEEERQARQNWSNMIRIPDKTRPQEAIDPDMELMVKYDDKKRQKDQKQVSFEMEQIAESLGFNVMYEYYPRRDNYTSIGMSDRKLGEALERIATDYGMEWTKSGKTIRFRPNNWAERRSWEIPVDWIQQWQGVIERKHTLDLDTLVDISNKMTDDQMEHNFFSYSSEPSSTIDDPLVVKLFDAAGVSTAKSNPELLGLFSRLSSSQKQRMWSKEGLPFEEMADDPIWGGTTPTAGNTPIYNISLGLSNGTTTELTPGVPVETVLMTVKMSLWLRDVPEAERPRLTKLVSEDALAKADSEPLQIEQSVPILRGKPDQVKQILEEMKKEREKREAELQKAKSESK